MDRESGQGRGRGRGRKSESLAPSSNANDENYEKRVIHREIERHRRQEMSNLYTSLRSVLPPEYIKGKRSVSDHVEEAVNYINNLKKNVKELGEKRDELIRKSHDQSSSSNNNEVGGSSNISNNVAIYPSLGGLAIDIRVSDDYDEFSLAIALQVVIEEGLSVASSTSTKVGGGFLHNILCEVKDATCIDVSRLQQRLIHLVC